MRGILIPPLLRVLMRYGGSLRVGQPRRAQGIPGRLPGLRVRWLGRRASACGVGQLVSQLHAGGDAELREYLVQVPLDRARAEEEMPADVLIGLPARGEPRDLLLLRGELAACLVTPFAHLLARRKQLAAGALGECVGAEADEQLIRGAELHARVHPSVLTPQPFAVDQVRAGELRPERRAAQPSDRLEI